MKLSKQQAIVLDLIKTNALKSRKGYYYYYVDTNTRRAGEMKVSLSTINILLKQGLITQDQIPQLQY